jgi:hypothetical protein
MPIADMVPPCRMRFVPLLVLCLMVLPTKSVNAQGTAAKPSGPQAPREDELFAFLPAKSREAEQCRAARQRDRAREDNEPRERAGILRACAMVFKATACAEAIRASARGDSSPTEVRDACCKAYAGRLYSHSTLCDNAQPLQTQLQAWGAWEEFILDTLTRDWSAKPMDGYAFTRWFIPVLVSEEVKREISQPVVTVQVALVRVNSALHGVIGPPVSAVGILTPMKSVTDVEPMALALRKTGLKVQVRLEPVEVSFDEAERARGALRAVGVNVLPPASLLEVRLVKNPDGVQALVAEPGFSPAPAWIGESEDVTQLLAQLRRWAPRAEVRLAADEGIPTKQVNGVVGALKKAGVNVRTSP